MTCPSDQLLAAQVRQGDERVFVTLVRRYERVLARLIGQYIGTGDDRVQDVLQETMASAWSALRKDTPRDVRAWIMQVARNRCRDYFRSTQRRELFVEDQTLELMVNRRGMAQARQRATASEVVEAMEEVTPQERAALRAFYVDGLSIAEIATRHQRPSGTIRRRLSHGRDQVRALLGGTRNERNRTMRQEKPFPEFRSAIRIEPSGEKPFRVDFTELVWWSSVPVVGDRVRLAHYEPLVANDGPWRLSCTVSSVARHPAVIHKRRCVEIECTDRYFDHAGFIYMTPASKKGRTSRFWGCPTEDGLEFVAVESVSPDGTRELRTFLDEGFDDDWGQANPRSLEDCGYLRQLADGSFSSAPNRPPIVAAGIFEVHIDERSFACLRVFDANPGATEADNLIEAYVTREGRTLMHRRYNGNRWGKRDAPPQNWGTELTWMEDLPHARRLVIDGVTYVHWYDCMTDVACGVAG